MIHSTRHMNGFVIAALISFAHSALAQTAATGSISGRVLSEEGRTPRAMVTLSFAAARGYPAPPRRVFTGSGGSFTFSKLPAGQYVLCAQVTAAETAPPNSPYVDTCVWPMGQTPIILAGGQQVTGLVFTAPKGTWLKFRVADPDHALSEPQGKGPASLDPELQLILKGPDGLFRHARFVSHDSGGRNYEVAIPLKTAVAVKLTSSKANVFDPAGKQLQDKDEVKFQPDTPSDLSPVTFTIRRK